MKKLLLVLVVVAAFLAGFGYERWYGSRHDHAATEKKATGYHCPMHPTYRSDKPGQCAICGMELVPDQPTDAAPRKGRIIYYRDPAEHDFVSDKPGLNPETGNELEPVYEAPAPGHITISSEKQQWIGLRSGMVERVSFQQSLRAPARVAVDETRLTRVTSRTEGWIEKVHADFVGRLVRKGEPLLTLYSPELTASQQEYLLALRARETLAGSAIESVRSGNHSLVEAARSRLEHHWGMDAKTIEQLERTGQAQRTATLYAPSSGFVMERKAYPGARVTPETELYSLADLGRVWIIADVFESDAQQIRLGQHAAIEPTHMPGRKMQGTVSYIFPRIDPQTRTLQVRIDAANPNFFLKPDLFVTVEFHIAGAPRLAVPEDAILDGGLTQIVFIDRGEGLFEPRRVETGEHFDGMVEIVAGLREGERIVVSGAFLLDSESKLKNPAQLAPPAAAPGAHQHD